MSICKHCGDECESKQMANHSRWCDKNPKRKDYVDALKGRNNVELMNEARKKSGIHNQFEKARIEGRDIPKHPMKGKEGSWKGRKHTEETKQLIREKALASNHRRLRKGTVMYKGVLLDSSWELELAKQLDEIGINWIRPDPLVWIDEDGVNHNYFPDFYLPEYNLYLDPKNPQAVRVQKKKLNQLLTQYENIVIIESIEDCRTYSPC